MFKPKQPDSGRAAAHPLFRPRTSLLVLLGAFSASPVWAQATAGKTAPSVDLASVVVLGSNRTDQKVLESTSPVDVITAQQLKESGATSLSEALVRLNPSVNFPQDTTGPQAATNGKSVALHGLSPDQTLVLVNGKRLVAQSTLTAGNPPMFGYMGHPIDINIIPFSAIERVEILRDGASALYGADAVAGVVNIVLKDRTAGGSVSAQLGQYTAEDKPHGAPPNPTWYLRGWKGFELPGEGFLTISGEVEKIFHPEEGVASPNPVYAPAGPAAQGNNPPYDPWRHLMGYAGPVKDYKFLANAEIGINDRVRVYGNASVAHFVKLGSSLTVPMYDAKAIIGLFPQGRDDFTEVTNDAITATAGIRFKDAQIGDFDLSINYGQNKNKSFQTLGYNQSLGLASPIGLQQGGTVNSLLNASLDWVKNFDVGQYKPLTLSAGVAARRDTYEAKEGEWASWYVAPGATIGPGHYRWNAATATFTALNPNTPVLSPGGTSPAEAGKWSRNVKSLYADAEGRATEKFSYGVAGRFEDYSDFGSTSSGKLSGRYDFTPEFGLRSTLSNGFRAPSLIQGNYTSKQASVAQGTLLVPSLALPTSDRLAVALGAKSLKPETSTNLSFGGVWQPTKDSSLTADVYHIRVKDKIVYSEALQDTGNGRFNAYLVANGFQSGTIARFFLNGVDTKTSGLDLVGRHQFSQEGVGRWDLSAAYSYSRTRVTRTTDTPAAVAATGQTLVGVVAKLMITDATPDSKLILGQKLTRGDWTFSLTEKRYGKYKEALISTTPTPQTFSAQWVVDLDIGYRFNKAFRVNFGAKNLFNSFPDTEWPSNRRVGQTNYPNLAPEGFDGRFLYANATWDFE